MFTYVDIHIDNIYSRIHIEDQHILPTPKRFTNIKTICITTTVETVKHAPHKLLRKY